MGFFGKPKPPPPPPSPNNPAGAIIAVAGALAGAVVAFPPTKKWIERLREKAKMTAEERRIQKEQARLQREKEAEERRIAREKREAELALRLEEEKKKQQEELERKRQEILNSCWWNIPEGKFLLVDTCVWMKANSEEIECWFKWIRKNAASKNWTIMLEHSVFQEIEKNRNQNGVFGYRARKAHSLIRKMQSALLPHKLFIWQNATVPNKAEDKLAYADPELVQRMKTDENIFLVTYDYSLAMAAKQITGSVERVLDPDNFIAMI